MDVEMPSYGVGLWIEGDRFAIRFPDQQLVYIPLSETTRLVSVLRHRESLYRAKGRATIGTKGAPVQYDIDIIAEALLRQEREAKAAEKAARERKALMRRVAKRQAEKEADELLTLVGLV